MMEKRTLLFSFALILFLGGSLLHATLVPRMSVEQMIDDSELIVHGTVLEKLVRLGSCTAVHLDTL